MEIKEIYKTWISTFATVNVKLAKQVFDEITAFYNDKKRYYHTLDHVASLFNQIETTNLPLEDKAILINVALFHDVIYKAGSKQNELRSSVFANVKLNQLNLDSRFIHSVCKIIEDTASHQSENHLNRLFIDMDLLVLAAHRDEYKDYCEMIKLEHKSIPPLLYNWGRKKFLKNMLAKPRIFLTEDYRIKHEVQARSNMITELRSI